MSQCSAPPIGTQLTPLRSVTIENFRGIRQMDLKLDPRVTVLFGPNAAGKTTVLDALSIGLGALLTRMPKVSGRDFARTGDLRVPYLKRDEVDEQPGVAKRFAHIRLESRSGLVWGKTSWRSAADREQHAPKVTARDLNTAVDKLVLDALNAAPDEPTAPIPLAVAYGNERAVL